MINTLEFVGGDQLPLAGEGLEESSGRDTTITSLLWWFIGFLYMSCRNFQNIILGSGFSVREAEVSGDGVFAIIEGSEPWLEFCHSYIGELEG